MSTKNPSCFFGVPIKWLIVTFLIFYLIKSCLIHVSSYYSLWEDAIKGTTKYILLAFEFIFFGISLMYWKKYSKMLVLLLSLGLVGFLGEYISDILLDSEYDLWKSITEGNLLFLAHMVFPFFFYISYLQGNINSRLTTRIFQVLEWVLFINAILVLLGAVFSIGLFQSYGHSYRFGYTGVIGRNILSSLSMIVILRGIFIRRGNYKIIFIGIALLLSGMKVNYLFYIVLLGYLAFRSRHIIAITGSLLGLLLSIVFIDPLVRGFIRVFPFFEPVYKEAGLINVLSSYRYNNLIHTLSFLREEGALWNFFFGGVDVSQFWIEIDYFDLLIMYGVLGAGIYFYLCKTTLNRLIYWVPVIVLCTSGTFIANQIVVCLLFIWAIENNLLSKSFSTKAKNL